MKTVLFTHAARKAFKALPADVQAQIKVKIDSYANGGPADVTKLQGVDGARIRVRDYRVIFVETADTLEIRAVGHRRDIYR